MLMWIAILTTGIAAGIGFTLVIGQLLPKQPSLADALNRLGTTTTDTTAAGGTLENRVGSWIHRQLPVIKPGEDRTLLRYFTIPSKDLALVGESTNAFLYKKALNALLGLILPFALGAVLNLLHIIPFYAPGILAIPLALLLWFDPDRSLRIKANHARQDFARAAAIYLELVAEERRRNAPAGIALETAAAIGRSWVFVRIRQVLVRARYAGIAPWDALQTFAEEIDVPDLADLANIVRLSGEDGAAIYETLRAKGRGLRLQLLNKEQTHANQISERMSTYVAGVAGLFICIIMTPMLMNLLS